MAIGTQLSELLERIRAEARLSQNPAHNRAVREQHVLLIRREQARLYSGFKWPHLRVKRLVPAKSGQRFYDLPADLDVQRLEKIEVMTNRRWAEMGYGIGEMHTAAYQSDLDERSYPPQRWELSERQVEIWPIPDRDAFLPTLPVPQPDPILAPAVAAADIVPVTAAEGVMRFTGIRYVKPLIHDTDRADLDDEMIVLYVAAGLLLASSAPDAQLKVEMANNRRTDLMNQLDKSTSVTMADARRGRARRQFDYIERYVP